MTQRESANADPLPPGNWRPRTTCLAMRDGVLQLSAILRSMIGKECWSSRAMEFTGSVLAFDIGDRIPWSPIATEGAPAEFGVFGIFITGAAWRMLQADAPVMTSDSPMTEGGVDKIAQVTQCRIRSATLSSETLDLQVQFESGATLDVFVNCFDESHNNYSISYGHNYYLIKCLNGRMAIILEEGLERAT